MHNNFFKILMLLGLLESVMIRVKLVHDVMYSNNENIMQDIPISLHN
jgi:hypothetical protein